MIVIDDELNVKISVSNGTDMFMQFGFLTSAVTDAAEKQLGMTTDEAVNEMEENFKIGIGMHGKTDEERNDYLLARMMEALMGMK